VIIMRLSIEEVRRRSVRYLHRFYLGGETETLVATGRITTACVRLIHETGKIESIEIPGALREKLEAAKTIEEN